MHRISIDEASTCLPELFDKAAQGDDVMIIRSDGTAMRLVPVARQGTPRFGSARGLFTMGDDFDAPPEEFEAFQR